MRTNYVYYAKFREWLNFCNFDRKHVKLRFYTIIIFLAIKYVTVVKSKCP